MNTAGNFLQMGSGWRISDLPMPQASFLAFARSCDLSLTATYFVTRVRPLNGNRTPLPSSQSMPSNVASMVLMVAFPVVTKSPVHPRGEL